MYWNVSHDYIFVTVYVSTFAIWKCLHFEFKLWYIVENMMVSYILSTMKVATWHDWSRCLSTPQGPQKTGYKPETFWPCLQNREGLLTGGDYDRYLYYLNTPKENISCIQWHPSTAQYLLCIAHHSAAGDKSESTAPERQQIRGAAVTRLQRPGGPRGSRRDVVSIGRRWWQRQLLVTRAVTDCPIQASGGRHRCRRRYPPHWSLAWWQSPVALSARSRHCDSQPAVPAESRDLRPAVGPQCAWRWERRRRSCSQPSRRFCHSPTAHVGRQILLQERSHCSRCPLSPLVGRR